MRVKKDENGQTLNEQNDSCVISTDNTSTAPKEVKSESKPKQQRADKPESTAKPEAQQHVESTETPKPKAQVTEKANVAKQADGNNIDASKDIVQTKVEEKAADVVDTAQPQDNSSDDTAQKREGRGRSRRSPRHVRAAGQRRKKEAQQHDEDNISDDVAQTQPAKTEAVQDELQFDVEPAPVASEKVEAPVASESPVAESKTDKPSVDKEPTAQVEPSAQVETSAQVEPSADKESSADIAASTESETSTKDEPSETEQSTEIEQPETVTQTPAEEVVEAKAEEAVEAKAEESDAVTSPEQVEINLSSSDETASDTEVSKVTNAENKAPVTETTSDAEPTVVATEETPATDSSVSVATEATAPSLAASGKGKRRASHAMALPESVNDTFVDVALTAKADDARPVLNVSGKAAALSFAAAKASAPMTLPATVDATGNSDETTQAIEA